jgi:hypothetical protein
LDDNAYAVRVGACERLKWMAASERLAQPIVLAVKHRLSDQCLSEDSYRRLESIREAARGFWLTADSADWKWPPASDTQLDEWLEELGRPAASGDPHTAVHRRIAQQDLMDVLCRDEDVPRIKAAIEAHLQGKLDQAPAGRLKELLDLTRPTLVAECWSGRRQTLEQHMIVGQPMYVAGFAAHPSHFDRADDRVAHCVSGNALNPGDYPVGVAFPPPNVANAVFQLNYLPTPRRQIAYSYDRQIDPAIRLARLSRCTLDRFLAEKRLLDDAELRMLAQLDVGEVSRFAGRYFLAVEDGTVEDEIGHEGPATGQGSCFAAICGQLAVEGTREAVPRLLEAIRRRRFRPPTAASPYRQQWLAALSIARRDPWPEVDTWLAQNIENRQALLITHDEWGRRTSRSASGGGNRQSVVVETDEAAEIGATAAGVLLVRHEQRPEAFGLQAVVDTRLSALKLPGFRYRAADDVQRVRQWWKEQARSP